MAKDIHYWIRLVEAERHGSPGETWQRMTINGRPAQVGWSGAKEQINLKKHGIGLADAIPAIFHPQTISYSRFEEGEDREIGVGPGRNGQLVKFVISLIEPDIHTGEELIAIRIISVRPLEPKERRDYMKKSIGEDLGRKSAQKPSSQKPATDVTNAERPLLPYILKRIDDFEAKKAAFLKQKKSSKPDGLAGG